jgi:hypothetical protein
MFCLGDDGATFDAIAMFGIFVLIFAIGRWAWECLPEGHDG